MVTGIYYPEISGAATQCRQLINALKKRAGFRVLTTYRDPNLPQKDQVNGIDVTRILWGKALYDYYKTILKLSTFFLLFIYHIQ